MHLGMIEQRTREDADADVSALSEANASDTSVISDNRRLDKFHPTADR